MSALDDIVRLLKKRDTKAAAELRQVRKSLERLAELLEKREKEGGDQGTPCPLCKGDKVVDIGGGPIECWMCEEESDESP
jgi:hypothetical protein